MAPTTCGRSFGEPHEQGYEQFGDLLKICVHVFVSSLIDGCETLTGLQTGYLGKKRVALRVAVAVLVRYRPEDLMNC